MEKRNKKMALIGLAIAIFFLASLAVLLTWPEKQKPIDPFKDCQILADSCKDQSCKYLFLCNETEFSDCRVYDCGDKYGMEIMGKDGSVSVETRQKLDQKKVQEMISKCRGSVEVLEKKCEGNKAIAKVKVITNGDCKINSFIMMVDGKNRIARFEKEGDVYNLSIGQCGVISEIKAVGESGVEIRE
jgi:hypothetical protein